jgi:hypothetical protein
MALPVPLGDVANELEALSEGMKTYIHRETGELLSLTNEELSFFEEGEEGEDLGWDEEMLTKLREVFEAVKWFELPDPFEIHEWEIMRDFADTLPDGRLRAEVLRALNGRRAFRRFKDTLYDLGIQENWFTFKHKAFEEIARKALDEAGIPYC